MKSYFENLDALRFLAFFGVFLYHQNYLFAPLFENHPSIAVFFSQGETAVSFFFVLSGFLISYLLLQEKKGKNTLSIARFFIKRILRIVPLYVFIVILGFVFIPWLGEWITSAPVSVNEHILPYTFFGANFDQIHLISQGIPNSRILSVLWSIAIEEQFYLIWPFFILIMPTKRLPFAFLLLIIGSFIFKYYYRDNELVLSYHSLSVASDLILGGLIAWLYIYSQSFVKFFKHLPKWIILLAYFFGFMSIGFNQYFSIIERYRIVLPLFWAFIILEQSISDHSLFKLKRLTWLSNLGKMSYGSYMYHGVVMVTLNLLFFANEDFVSNIGAFEKISLVLLNFILTLLLSYLSFHYFEAYFIKFKHKIHQSN